MPNIWAIAYDLDVRGMKDAGYTKGNVTTFYNSVRQCLTCNRFEKMQQLSIYASDKPNSAWFKSWVFQVTVRTVPMPRRWKFFLSSDRWPARGRW